MSCWISLGCVDGQGIGAARCDGICIGRQCLGPRRQRPRAVQFDGLNLGLCAAPEASGRLSVPAFEGACECALIRETGQEGDLGQSVVRASQQLFGQ